MIHYRREISKMLAAHLDQVPREEIQSWIEIPADKKMGDFAFPCFQLAKIQRKSPMVIAEDLATKLREKAWFDKVESVKGYVNMYLKRSPFAKEVLGYVNENPQTYGSSSHGKGQKVLVEFSSPNIAKPFHIGHIRSTVIGNALAKIYEALGYDVEKLNHLGDYGTQFGKMICAYRRWGNREDVVKEPIKTLLHYYTKFHEEEKENPQLTQEAREIFTRLENQDPEEVELWQWFREESLREFTKVYNLLGIDFDSYAGESFYSDKMPRIIQELEEKKLIQESRGARIVDLEPYGMAPALIQKSDGSTLYITRDIAAAVYRKETYNFEKNIYVVASQQNLHFQQWIKIIELLGYSWAKDCIHVPFGLVSLKDGTMSTRAGRVVFLEDVLNKAVEQTKKVIQEKGVVTDDIEETAKAVGIGAVIFQELSNNRIKDYVFDWDRVLNFEGETGPYVQYTHARACSVLRKAGIQTDSLGSKPKNLPVFTSSEKISNEAYDLIKLIYQFPDVVAEAGKKNEPSVITRHIINVAQAFNRFYHNEHILVDDLGERQNKLAMVLATKITVANGLNLLGIQAPERM